MKKIAIVTRKLVMGGVERCLITMLKKYANNCEVTLFVMEQGGELYDEIPNNVRILQIPGIGESWKKKILKYVMCGKVKKSVQLFENIVKLKKEKNFSEQCRLLSGNLPDVEEKYDIAISYYVPISFPVVYTLDHIKAKQKYIWFHTDPEKMGINLYEMRDEHSHYDLIIGVSEHISEVTKRLEPENKEKIITIYNCYDVENIILKSKKSNELLLKKSLMFVTVGRICPEKRQVCIPKIASWLKNDNILFKWFVVGDGSDNHILKELIQKFDVKDSVILVGNKDNPYQYMEKCDIYIQTSEYEGFCTTTFEAKILGKVVITTDVSGAREQFSDKVDGIIVERTPEGIYKGIKSLLQNKELYDKIEKNVKKFKYSENKFYGEIFGE